MEEREYYPAVVAKLHGLESQCLLCGRIFGGSRGIDLHLVWQNEDHTIGPDGNYRKCIDPSLKGLIEKNGVWIRKFHYKRIAKPKTEEISCGPVGEYQFSTKSSDYATGKKPFGIC